VSGEGTGENCCPASFALTVSKSDRQVPWVRFLAKRDNTTSGCVYLAHTPLFTSFYLEIQAALFSKPLDK
jgi:hypothetical protein